MTRTTANVEGSWSTMGIAIGSRFEAIVASCASFERKSDALPYNTRETDVDDCVSSYAPLVSTALDRGKCNQERERERERDTWWKWKWFEDSSIRRYWMLDQDIFPPRLYGLIEFTACFRVTRLDHILDWNRRLIKRCFHDDSTFSLFYDQIIEHVFVNLEI